MAASNRSKTISHAVETATIPIEEGLVALRDLAHAHAGGNISGDTLATSVEQMAGAMLANVRALYNIADGKAGTRHG